MLGSQGAPRTFHGTVEIRSLGQEGGEALRVWGFRVGSTWQRCHNCIGWGGGAGPGGSLFSERGPGLLTEGETRKSLRQRSCCGLREEQPLWS